MEEREAQESQHEGDRREGRPEKSLPPSLTQPHPWLVIFDCNDGCGEDCRQTFYSISRDHFYERFIPEMPNKCIVSSQQKWLFLEDNATDDCFLFNMSTLEKLQLPALDIDDLWHNTVVSSSSKIDGSCRILVIRRYSRKFKSCYLGDKEFIDGKFDIPRDNFAVLNYEGKLYVLAHLCSWCLMVADFDDPELHFTPVINDDRSISQSLKISDEMKVYLVESNGELLFVYTNHFDRVSWDIKIFKAKFDTNEWEEIFSLENRALFLDDFKGLSSSATVSDGGLRDNCVYYVNTYGDRNLYIYDMKEKSVVMSLPCPTVNIKESSLFWAL